MERFKGMLIEDCILCGGELKPASEGKYAHIYADYFYDNTGQSEVAAGVYICPSCKFVLSDTRYWDGPNYSISFAYDDKYLDDMHTMLSQATFETCNKHDSNYKKLLQALPKIKERINGINDGRISEPFEK